MKRRLLILFTLMISISLILSCVFWWWIGRNFNLRFGILDIDFFYTFCGTVTIVGFVIAIYQIAEIRTEQELKSETKKEVALKYFKDEAIFQIGKLTQQLQQIRRDINEQIIFSEKSVRQYITALNNIEDIIGSLTYHQESLNCGNIIDCTNLVSLQSKILNNLYDIIKESKYSLVRKQTINSEIGELILKAAECERRLKS